MVLSLALAGIIVAAAVLCLFFRYKDGSPFGSITAGLLFFILSAMLLTGLSVPGTVTASTYDNAIIQSNTSTCANGTWNSTLLYPPGYISGHYLAGYSYNGLSYTTIPIYDYAGSPITSMAWYRNATGGAWVHYANASGAYYYNGVASPLGYHPMTTDNGYVYAGVSRFDNISLATANETDFNRYANTTGTSVTLLRGVRVQAKTGLTVRNVTKYSNCTAIQASLTNAARNIFYANATFTGTDAVFNYHFDNNSVFYVLIGNATSYTSAWKSGQNISNQQGNFSNLTAIFNGTHEITSGITNIFNVANITMENDTAYTTVLGAYFNGTLDNTGAWKTNMSGAEVMAEAAALSTPAKAANSIYYDAYDGGDLPYYHVGNCSGVLTVQYSTNTEKVLASQETAPVLVNNFVAQALSVIALGAALLFLLDAIKLYTTKRAA